MVIRANDDGQILYLKDVADIELGRLTYGFKNFQNGHNAVSAMVYQAAGSNATAIIGDITNLLEDIKKDLPPGMEIETTLNANDFLFASIHEVIKTLIEAFIFGVLCSVCLLARFPFNVDSRYRYSGVVDRYVLCLVFDGI